MVILIKSVKNEDEKKNHVIRSRYLYSDFYSGHVKIGPVVNLV